MAGTLPGSGINIAVIDSGCFVEHEQLKNNILDVYNFTEDDNANPNNVSDYLGHGTHTAGIIAASNIGKTIGVAPKSKLLILKVFGKTRNSNYEKLTAAINYAVNWRGENNEKIDVINLSLGGSHKDRKMKLAINHATANNVLVVAAAGNAGDGSESTNEILYPGFYKEVIQVGAIDEQEKPTHFSNTNLNIDFVAPGQAIYSTYKEGGYATISGTSMASPHATGAIALLLNFFKENHIPPTLDRVYQYFSAQAKFIEGYSYKTQGNGIIRL